MGLKKVMYTNIVPKDTTHVQSIIIIYIIICTHVKPKAIKHCYYINNYTNN